MSRVKSIKIQNLKAITEFEADFNGCTAIVIGKNNGGKTTLLRSIPDRVRFIRPDCIVKKGSTKGKGELTLTTGEKFVWEFDDARLDKLTFISSENIRQNVTKELGAKYFPPMFDIDKFLQSSPKEQSKQFQKIVGLDFTDVDKRYDAAYAARTARNLESEKYHVKLSAMLKVDKVDAVDLTVLQGKKEVIRNELNSLYKANKEKNDIARKEWISACDVIRKEVQEFNENEANKVRVFNSCTDALSILKLHGYDGKEAQLFVDELANGLNKQKTSADLLPTEPTYTPEMPDDAPMKAIDQQIIEASEINERARQYREYIQYKEQTEQAKTAADNADILVKQIEAERNTMIASANFPKGISITPDGIMIDGLPLDRNQVSTSLLYTTALRIASMNLGEVKTLYFDASFLDRNSLADVEKWANENDLQLLIERPDFEGGEIKYELIENDITNAAQATLL